MENLTTSKKIFNVSEINQQIKSCLESQFSSLWIKGELSNFIAHNSGHWYFSLKDKNSQIKAVMFRGQNQKLSIRPQNGTEILVQGHLSAYPPRGDYQILCFKMEVVGSGSLQKQFEDIKQKLKEEGLFDSERKHPLPPFPRHIALITSPTGAAIRDILQILNRRFKGVNITLIPALVQGEQASASLLKALSLSEKLSADVLIIGRGGGSMEDLWAFNDETLARAIAHHPIPVISAVGHEIDFTICDFVSDLRAPTPSAAAELVVKNGEELLGHIKHLEKQFVQNIHRQFQTLKSQLISLKRSFIRPDRLLLDFSQRLDEMSLRLEQALKQVFEKSKDQIENYELIFKSLNPKKIMQRGFSIVSNKKGKAICNTKDLNIKDSISITFFKGEAQATITQKE